MQNSFRALMVAPILALAATIGVAHAAPPVFYAGVDVLRLTTKIDDKTGVPPIVTGSADATTLRLKGGAQFLEWLDAEVHLVLPQSETYSTTAGRANTVETSVIGVFAKPNISAGPMNFYALLGFAQTKIELAGAVSGSESASGVAYGAGVQYAFTRNISGSIDYMQYHKKNFPLAGFSGGLDTTVNAIGVGVAYTFK